MTNSKAECDVGVADKVSRGAEAMLGMEDEPLCYAGILGGAYYRASNLFDSINNRTGESIVHDDWKQRMVSQGLVMLSRLGALDRLGSRDQSCSTDA